MEADVETRDARETTKLFLIREHMAQFTDELSWSRERYLRLCGMLRLTPFELGALFRANISEITRWLHADRFPPYVELHLTMIERCYRPSATPAPFYPLTQD